MVLLKNQEEVLPLNQNQKVALIGVTSFDMYTGGTGSGDVNEAYIVSLEEGLANTGIEINERSIEMFDEHKETNAEAFVRPEGLSAMMNPYNPPEINYGQEDLEQLAAGSDVAIVTIGRNSGEGYDRVELDDFLLTETEKEMIQNTCETFHTAGKKVIVVLNIGGVIETASWKERPDAILLAWQGGQEGGNSIADILSGKVNPSGKLPMTFPVNLDDHASNENFPLEGKQMEMMEFIMGGDEKPEDEKVRNEDYTLYEEGIYVGYRHFDKAGLDVSYPFGYGLSYTDFDYETMAIDVDKDTITVSVTVQNSGDVAGKEVVQLYVSKANPTIDRPVQELKGFAKTELLPAGSTQEITLSIPVNELRYWNEATSSWMLEPGIYEIRVGPSSRDIRLSGDVDVM
jgi:beta-glucosidase